MATKSTKNKKQTRPSDAGTKRQNSTAQIIFAVFAVILILSMVFSAFANF
jgi:hypothetical protein